MHLRRRSLRLAFAGALTLAASTGPALADPVLAYIGPGAGFAAAGSLLVLAGTFAMAFGIILVWPLKAVVKVLRTRGRSKAKVKRMIVLGLDGFDPGLAQRYSEEGRMPNFRALAEQGCFRPLATEARALDALAHDELWRGMLELELRALDAIGQLLVEADARLNTIARADTRVTRLRTIPGVGPRLAEILVATIDDPKRFRNARQVACYAGLTPKQ